MTKKEREVHYISYINPNNSPFDNLHEYITKCSNCGCGLSNVAFYCPICGVKINERVVHARDDSIIIYPSWIPVSERLPNDYEYIKNNGMFNVSDGDRSYSEWFDPDKQMFGEPTMTGFRVDKCVIAWMPLPEPYEGGAIANEN